MSKLERLRDPTARSFENPATPLSHPDNWLVDALGGGRTSSGEMVNRSTAMTYSAVWRAVNLISRDVGKLPLLVYRRVGDGKERATGHPAYLVLKARPGANLTPMTFKQTLQAHVLLTGNGYAWILRTGTGMVAGMVILDPDVTFPVRANGELRYVTRYKNTDFKLDADQVFHLKGLSFDGLVGYSVLEAARETLGLGLGMRKFGSIYFRNNARAAVVLQHPGRLSPEAAENLRNSWDRMHTTIDNAHKTAILEEGMEIKQLSINARDSQLIESRQFEIREVANFFGVPPHKLGDTTRTAYASLEQENQSYLDESLDPHLVAFEEEAEEKLLTDAQRRADAYMIEFQRKALVRANLEARFKAYHTGIQAGFLSRNEARAAENLNPEEGLDEFLEPLNMQPAGSDEPEPEGSDDENRADAPPEKEALRVMLEDVIGRMSRRLAQKAKRKARTPDSYMDWVDGLHEEAAPVIREALRPGVQVACLIRGGDVDELCEKAAAAVCHRFGATLLTAAEVMPEALPAAVGQSVDALAAALPAEVTGGLFEE